MKLTPVFLAGLLSLANPAWAGLVAHYTFDGNTADSSGNGNDATANGATLTTDRFGNANSAYAFDGSSAYVATAPLGYPSALNPGGQSWTVSAWINTNGVANGTQLVLGRYECGWYCYPTGGPSAALYNLALVDNTPVFTIRTDAESLYSASAGASISTGDWHLLTGVLDQTALTLSIYVDGVLSGSTAIAAGETITDGGSALNIGRWDRSNFASPINYFSGSIDEVRIWNTAVDNVDAAPEPASLALLGLGLIGLCSLRRHRY